MLYNCRTLVTEMLFRRASVAKSAVWTPARHHTTCFGFHTVIMITWFKIFYKWRIYCTDPNKWEKDKVDKFNSLKTRTLSGFSIDLFLPSHVKYKYVMHRAMHFPLSSTMLMMSWLFLTKNDCGVDQSTLDCECALCGARLVCSVVYTCFTYKNNYTVVWDLSNVCQQTISRYAKLFIKTLNNAIYFISTKCTYLLCLAMLP